jgi:hypothetical protein
MWQIKLKNQKEEKCQTGVGQKRAKKVSHHLNGTLRRKKVWWDLYSYC